MNYSYGTGPSENFNSNNHSRMLESYENECYLRSKSLFDASNPSAPENIIHHQFECLINEAGVNVDTIASENKTDEDILQSSTSSNSSNSSYSYNINNASNRYHQHQQQQHYAHMHQQNVHQNSLEYSHNTNSSLNNIYFTNKKAIKQDTNLNENSSQTYTSEKSIGFSNENKFQYFLMAPTSPAVKTNEDTLTYLNQGQNYELRLSLTDSVATNNSNLSSIKMCNNFENCKQDKTNPSNYLEDIKPLIINGKPNINMNDINANSNNNGQQSKYQTSDSNDAKTNPVYLSIIRLCFWDRKLQETELQEIKEVRKVIKIFF